jgi:hypothetical protein
VASGHSHTGRRFDNPFKITKFVGGKRENVRRWLDIVDLHFANANYNTFYMDEDRTKAALVTANLDMDAKKWVDNLSDDIFNSFQMLSAELTKATRLRQAGRSLDAYEADARKILIDYPKLHLDIPDYFIQGLDRGYSKMAALAMLSGRKDVTFEEVVAFARMGADNNSNKHKEKSQGLDIQGALANAPKEQQAYLITISKLMDVMKGSQGQQSTQQQGRRNNAPNTSWWTMGSQP